MLAIAIKHLVALGMGGDELAAAIAEMQAAEDTRSTGARRQQRYRDRQRNETSQSVTRDAKRDKRNDTPSLDKESFPQTPFKEINPNPVHIRARKAAGFDPPEGVSETSWTAFASQRKKRLTQIAYDRILRTLEDCKRAGYPPGEMIDLAIERGWETVFVPKEQRNGHNGRLHQQPDLRGSRPDPALTLLRLAREAEAEEGAASDYADRGRAWTSLPAIGSG